MLETSVCEAEALENHLEGCDFAILLGIFVASNEPSFYEPSIRMTASVTMGLPIITSCRPYFSISSLITP
jgi:hypothetical protein